MEYPLILINASINTGVTINTSKFVDYTMTRRVVDGEYDSNGLSMLKHTPVLIEKMANAVKL